MRKIFDRYILREVTTTWLGMTLVLVLILVSTRFAQFLGDAASGKLPKDAVFTLLGLSALQNMTILMPLSLFLSIVWALGRLYKDSEMTAIGACGVRLRNVYKPLFYLSVFAASLLSWLAFELGPQAAKSAYGLSKVAQQEALMSGFEAGRFKAIDRDRSVFYAEQISTSGERLTGVFVKTVQDNEPVIITAKSGWQRIEQESGSRVLVLYDGYRYQGKVGSRAYTVIRFEEHGVRAELPTSEVKLERQRFKPSGTLLESNDIADKAEWHWRLSVPISAMVLTFLAIPVARVSPRQGRYARIFLAIFVYVTYSNLLGLGQLWIEQGKLPGWLGMWWIHLLLIILAVFMLIRQNGWQWARGVFDNWERAT